MIDDHPVMWRVPTNNMNAIGVKLLVEPYIYFSMFIFMFSVRVVFSNRIVASIFEGQNFTLAIDCEV